MPKRQTADRLLVLAAARMSAQGCKQSHIADNLHRSQATVSRLVRRARESGFLTEELRLPRLTALESAQLDAMVRPGHTRLVEELGREGVQIRVLGYGGPKTSDNWPERLTAFGEVAAPDVAELLARSMVCGVAWGPLLSALVRGLEGLDRPRPWKARPTHFIPVTGESLEGGPAPVSASTLARRLDELVNGDPLHRHSFSLGGVPAFVPEHFGDHELNTIVKFISWMPAYREVFGDEHPAPIAGRIRPWIERVHLLLTGVGTSERPLGHVGNDFLGPARGLASQLSRVIIGDIAGVLLVREDISAADNRRVERLNRLWTGIQEHHLRACAQRAFKKGIPGVVLIAMGAKKVTVVREVLKRRLANRLIIDADLASELSFASAGR